MLIINSIKLVFVNKLTKFLSERCTGKEFAWGANWKKLSRDHGPNLICKNPGSPQRYTNWHPCSYCPQAAADNVSKRVSVVKAVHNFNLQNVAAGHHNFERLWSHSDTSRWNVPESKFTARTYILGCLEIRMQYDMINKSSRMRIGLTCLAFTSRLAS